MATLPGVPFYEARGYVAGSAITQIYDGVGVRFVPMHKPIHQQEETRAHTHSG